MKPLLDVLIILDALDKEGSFAAASAKLYKTPSALSYTVHKLESELNIQLLDRSGHRATFTRAGVMLLEKGRTVLRSVRDLEQQVVRLHEGWESTLTVGIDATFPLSLLIPLVVDFYQQHHVTRLTLMNCGAASWQALANGQVDMVVGALGEPLVDEAICTSPLGKLERVCVMAAQHPLAQSSAPLSRQRLKLARAIVLAAEQGKPWHSDQEYLTVFDEHTRVELLLSGVGIGFVPRYQVQHHLHSGELVVKTLADTMSPETAWIGWNERTTGLSCGWWRASVLANSAINEIYGLKGA